MKKMDCPHCNVPNDQTHAENTFPAYNFSTDEYREEMFCSVCDGHWVRVYKPSHDIKEE